MPVTPSPSNLSGPQVQIINIPQSDSSSSDDEDQDPDTAGVYNLPKSPILS